ACGVSMMAPWLARRVACFFFQAEDGIRDWSVTGVQTCALPISLVLARCQGTSGLRARTRATASAAPGRPGPDRAGRRRPATAQQIGRASCREREWGAVGAVG